MIDVNTRRGRGRPVSDNRQKIMELTSLGYTNKEIASRLAMTEDNVDYHLKQIYREAGIAGRTSMNNRVYIVAEYYLNRLRQAHF